MSVYELSPGNPAEAEIDALLAEVKGLLA